jgi:hypothetical protein
MCSFDVDDEDFPGLGNLSGWNTYSGTPKVEQLVRLVMMTLRLSVSQTAGNIVLWVIVVFLIEDIDSD